MRVDVARDTRTCGLTVPIQREVWGDEMVVPPGLMHAAAESGGFVALGYAGGDPEPAGFVFGFAGLGGGRLRHHSHMLAVRAPHRSSGLAKALKEAQRSHCLAQGIDVVEWTMDPLEARNARFSFGTLGARSRTYHRDYYGAMPDRLNAGMPSDRLTIEWTLGDERTGLRPAAAPRPETLEAWERDAAWVLRDVDGDPAPSAETSGRPHLLAIPTDVQRLKRDDPASALRWRIAVRDAFERSFASGHTAEEFVRGRDGRGAYVLRPA